MSTATPVRLQRSRVKGSRLVSPNGLPIVCVTRPGKWGNPVRVGDVITYAGEKKQRVESAEEAVEHYRSIANWIRINEPERLDELRGKNLACFCPLGKPCHADVLLALANAPSGGPK